MGGRNIANVSGQDDEDEEMPTRRQQHPPPRLDWKKLGQKACVAFRKTPSIDFMYVHFSLIILNSFFSDVTFHVND